MFWTAGQKRMEREDRKRLTELYVGVRDGYLAAEATVGRVTMRGDATPSYAQPDPAQRRVSAARGLAQLMRDFPSSVSKGPAEMN